MTTMGSKEQEPRTCSSMIHRRAESRKWRNVSWSITWSSFEVEGAEERLLLPIYELIIHRKEFIQEEQKAQLSSESSPSISALALRVRHNQAPGLGFFEKNDLHRATILCKRSGHVPKLILS
jgi:hypothetical protein